MGRKNEQHQSQKRGYELAGDGLLDIRRVQGGSDEIPERVRNQRYENDFFLISFVVAEIDHGLID